MTQLITQELAKNSIKQFRFSWLRQRTVPAITIAVIVFFKPLVTRLYLPPSQLPAWAMIVPSAITLFIAMETVPERNTAKKNKLVALSCAFNIGAILKFISSMLWNENDVALFIEQISMTSRLGWIALMFTWENIVPSVCLIVHFVTQIYLLVMVLKVLGYINDLREDILIEVWVDRDIKKAVIAVALSGCWIYPAMLMLYFLLQ